MALADLPRKARRDQLRGSSWNELEKREHSRDVAPKRQLRVMDSFRLSRTRATEVHAASCISSLCSSLEDSPMLTCRVASTGFF